MDGELAIARRASRSERPPGVPRLLPLSIFDTATCRSSHSSEGAVGVCSGQANTGYCSRGKRAVSSPIRAAARRLPGASCGPACASPGRCSRPGDPARLLRPWQRKRASAASDEQSDRQLSAGASRQTGPQLTSSTDSDSDLTRCAVREGSIPARTESGRPVWGMGRIRDSCAKRLLCVQAGRVERVRGAPDWLVVRGSSLFGLHALRMRCRASSG